MKIHSIETGKFKLDGGAMHGVVPKTLWQKYNPADESNLCSWSMRCLLIELDNHLILVDTGIGNKQDEKFLGHYHLHGEDSLKKSIKNAGYAPEEITDVFLTHLHFDHVGGAVDRVGEQLLPAFSNAKYWTNKAHWDWAVDPNDREKASFLKENIFPLQDNDQLDFIDVANGDEWLPGFNIVFVNGHTEQMMLPLLNYKGQNILYCADLMPSMAHIPLPWIMGYDMRPLETLKEKKMYLEQAVQSNTLLFFEHDFNVELCSLEKTEKGIKAKDVIKLADLG